MNPYNSMGNNPVSFSDPNGDDFGLSILIGAAIGVAINGIGNAANGQNFFQGAGKAALVGGIGGALGTFGGGSLLNNIAWGAIEGGITGGIGAELNGGNFGDGFLKGSLIGAGTSFAFSLPEAIPNARDGFGFNTDIGSFQKAAKDAVNNGVVDPAGAQRALDFWTNRFGGPQLNYLPTMNAAGAPQSSHVNPFTAEVNISGVNFIQGPKHVTRTIVHETAHYNKSIIWQGGNVGGRPTGRFRTEGVAEMRGNAHGTIGYYDAIRDSGKFNMGFRSVARGSGNGFNSQLVPIAWNSFGKTKWWYLIPRRF